MPINFQLRKYKKPVFTETGTYQGEGVTNALRAGFKKIYSIELSEKFYQECLIRFEKEIKESRVCLILGDSSRCLFEVIKNIKDETTFWLDAHFIPKYTPGCPEDVPLLKELEAISKHPIKTHTILIDDVRLFGTTNIAGNWSSVKLDCVIEALNKINKNYIISYENGAIKNDVLVAEIRKFEAHKILWKVEELARRILRPARNLFHLANKAVRLIQFSLKKWYNYWRQVTDG